MAMGDQTIVIPASMTPRCLTLDCGRLAYGIQLYDGTRCAIYVHTPEPDPQCIHLGSAESMQLALARCVEDAETRRAAAQRAIIGAKNVDADGREVAP
jgi:hypothetical protein